MRSKHPPNDLGIQPHSILQNACYCLKNTAACEPWLLLWCALAVSIAVTMPLLSTFLPKLVIELILGGEDLSKLVATVLAFMLGIALLSALKRFLEKIIYFRKYTMNTYYTRQVAYKGMTSDYANQEQEDFRRLQSEGFNACNGHGSPLTQIYDVGIALLASAFGFGIYFGLLAHLSAWVVVLLVASALASYALNQRTTQWAAEHNAQKASYQQRTNYINRVSGDLRAAKDIRLYGMAAWLDQIYRANIQALSGWYRRYTAKVFGVSTYDAGLSALREGVAYAYLLSLVLRGRIGVAEFVLYFGLITGFSAWLGEILGQVVALQRINLAVDRLRAYLDYPDPQQNPGGLNAAVALDAPKALEVRAARYRYAHAEQDALQGIDLTIQPGEHLAIVGLNGAGKTTLVKLLCGLCDPTEGAVCYGGIDIRQCDRASYYKLFSAVFQQFSILPVSIQEIIAEDARVDAPRAAACLRQAGLWEKVAALPKGMDSEFGKTIYDDGVELSGGEIQKLLLARALYKPAPMMILDEPTAALDPISESALYETYHEVMHGRTTVFISHRLASTRFCDRIILMEHGAILEEGTHEGLLAEKGRYYELFETQAKYYRAQEVVP